MDLGFQQLIIWKQILNELFSLLYAFIIRRNYITLCNIYSRRKNHGEFHFSLILYYLRY